MTAGELEAYFEESASWDTDRRAQSERSARIAWLVAGAGWLAVVLSAIALVVLMPLKRVEPFVIRVDNTTGIVDVVPVYAGKADLAQTITRYLLSHYVTVCERFNFSTAESDYEECGSFHTPQRNQAWSAAWSLNNPASPLNRYKDGTTVRAQVESVSFFNRANGVADLAQVRYAKEARLSGADQGPVTHWIATIQYAYADPPSDPRTRRWNPLGFKIVDFKPEPEVLPDSVTKGSPTAATVATGVSRGSP